MPEPSFEIVMSTSSADHSAANWHRHQEGQLAVDVIETKYEVIVVSTIAGAVTEEIDVAIHNDMLTIRGRRMHPLIHEKIQQLYHEECYWGAFSRSVVLPVDVRGDEARAEYSNGVLTVRVPKKMQHKKIPVIVVEE